MSDPFSSLPKGGATQSKSQVEALQIQSKQDSSLQSSHSQTLRPPEVQTVATPTQTYIKPTATDILSLALKPASIQFSSKTDHLSIEGNRFIVSFLSIAKRQLAAIATSYQLVANQEVLDLQSIVTTSSKASNTIPLDLEGFGTSTATSGSSDINARQAARSESKLTLNQINSILFALGKSTSILLPKALKLRLNQQGLDIQQMKVLSSRSQGYPLPMAQLSDNKLRFSNGTSVPISNITAAELANNGQLSQNKQGQLNVIPSIHYQNNYWLLTLKPVIDELEVKLTPEGSKLPITPIKGEQVLLAKPEIGNIYSQLFKVLSQVSMDSGQAIGKSNPTPELQAGLKSNHSQTFPLTDSKEQVSVKKTNEQVNKALGQELSKNLGKESAQLPTSKESLKPIELNTKAYSNHIKIGKSAPDTLQPPTPNTMQESLQKTYGKVSGEKVTAELTAKSANSLLAKLTKLLPQLRPLSLNALALPSAVKDELSGIASLHTQILPQSMTSSSLSHMSSIGLLFQLLLGVKSGNVGGNTDKLSQPAQKYLHKLQAQLGGSTALLNLLDKVGTTESLGKLFSNLSLYSQASSDTSTQVNWYFTLPYSLNQHQEELEGQFSKHKDDDDPKMNNWHLQLKFNLTTGPLLIQAQVKDNKINMTFNGSNDTLLKKIDALLPPLMNKLADIGFTPNRIETKLTKVPATLLPGEHFLVKIKA
ncbi:hypothetical protein [Shewanella violacea]|nr:hypothetical protein [Shewanella violacea]